MVADRCFVEGRMMKITVRFQLWGQSARGKWRLWSWHETFAAALIAGANLPHVKDGCWHGMEQYKDRLFHIVRVDSVGHSSN